MRPAGPCREWRKARRRSWITQARQSRQPVSPNWQCPSCGQWITVPEAEHLPCPGPVQRFTLPAVPPVTEDEIYAALVSWGGLVVAAESGIITELVRPDGRVAGRVVPA
jgi:hypothetical protein